jgi:hypothetical protein
MPTTTQVLDHRIEFDPSKHVNFCPAALETYAFAKREAIVIDAMTLVSAVEYADRIVQRRALRWSRDLAIRVPVFDLTRWQDSKVVSSLHEALTFLTGDSWQVDFVQRPGAAPSKPQDSLPLPSQTISIIAYSDGLDSRAVAGIISKERPDSLLRVRVGSKATSGESIGGKPVPFTGIPYQLNLDRKRIESTARSRGFKFAVFAGIASYLANAAEIIIAESGQGIFGPALLPVMHAHSDYRNHPLFTTRVEKFILALLGHTVNFRFPRLWSTKAETLSEYVSTSQSTDWLGTRSCWQDSRWCSFKGKRRQCGICAACMLRRMSVHAAGLSEPDSIFICENLRASALESSVVEGFTHCGKSFRNYAIAGVLQLDHFGDLTANAGLIARHSSLVAIALSIEANDAGTKLANLIERHASEWKSFVDGQGDDSFLRAWTRGGQ